MGRWAKNVAIALAAAACATATVLLIRRLRERAKRRKVQDIVDEFKATTSTPVDRLREIADRLESEMVTGLESVEGSRLKMLPSFVDRLPDGSESGVFYALDLGGTNFRVLRVILNGRDGIGESEYEEVPIPPKLMTGETQDLFDFIAAELKIFVAREGSQFHVPAGRVPELGFTFSFPCKQTAINAGTLVCWTKGFNIPDAIGEDVVDMLTKAMERQGLEMRVTALVNDTVGTLAGARHVDPDAMVAVILGTGSNACYVEQIAAVPKWKGPVTPSGTMVINMEWGNFASESLPLSAEDRMLDATSINPGEQILEKVVAGLYLGEIVRLVLYKASIEGELFGYPIPPKLAQPYVLPTPKVSQMDEDDSADLRVVARTLSDILGIHCTTMEQRRLVHSVCSLVGERGARVAAAGVYGVLKKIGRAGSSAGGSAVDDQTLPPRTFVAVDGGLYEHYAKYRGHMHAALRELLGEKVAKNIHLDLSKDGSGIGAALLAASHSSYVS